MKGNNELRLNHATMIEALQLWVNANFVVPVKVESVDQLANSTYCKDFSVKLADMPTEEVT